ncbi:MAG: hypothetical protein SGBAC_003402 [Bacillariaceae sp.]
MSLIIALSLVFLSLTTSPVAKAWSPPSASFLNSLRAHHRRHGHSSLHQTDVDTIATSKKQRLVVVGGGIGGLSSAYDARHLLRTDDEIVVISAREDFQFTPSNPWVATRQRTEADISLSLPKILPKFNIDFINSAVNHLDPSKQQLKLDNGETVDYDFLIIATGPRLAFEDIPGQGPKKYSTSVCTTPHAGEAASAVDQLQQHPGPAVIGAVQGASCFGPAYEFAFLLHHELHKRGGKKLVEQCPITFVTSEPYVGHLGLAGAGDSRKILEKLFAKKEIEYFTNCKVEKLTKESVSIEYLESDGVKHTKTIPSKFNMLIPQFKGMEVWSRVPSLTDKHGMILINEHQQSLKYPNIFGVGICVHLDALEKTPIPTGAPKTGYMIESMGTAAIKNIRTMIDAQEQELLQKKKNTATKLQLHYKPLLNGLCITDFGNDGAIFLTLPQMPPRRTDITIDGRVATLAKIAFEKYFLYKIKTGDTDPYYEKYMLHLIGVDRTEKGSDI